MGRKKAQIDWDLVEKMAKRHCDGVQIAARLGIHPETLYGRVSEKFKVGFSEWMSTKKADGKSVLIEEQWKKAEKGDNTMLIFLGKQYLGQSEKSESKVDQNINLPQFVWEEGTQEKDNG